jgi:hypothetical protein
VLEVELNAKEAARRSIKRLEKEVAQQKKADKLLETNERRGSRTPRNQMVRRRRIDEEQIQQNSEEPTHRSTEGWKKRPSKRKQAKESR